MSSDEAPDITPPELTSETWVHAQETILSLGNALREIAANAEDPDIVRHAINALIKTDLQGMFLGNEI